MAEPTEPAPRAPRPRGGGPRALGEAVAALTGPIIARRGFARGALMAEWPTIVGERLAASCVPERIAYPPKRSSGGTLRLRVASGSLAMELQHLEPILIERINAYFGHRAIDRVKLIQGPVSAPAQIAERPPPPRPLTGEEERRLNARLAGVGDAALRATLDALGRAVIGRSRREPQS
ncbi:MAG: DUF721 domain-containing protein [Rhodospirillales bacterium]|nr:DUF721 domain-containing protein [Rhodospirillales bacterium]